MIHIIWNEPQCQMIRAEGRVSYTEYVFELLTYLGLSYTKWSPSSWMAQLPGGLTIVVGESDDPQWEQACEAYCRDGNTILAIGGLFGLDRLYGVTTVSNDVNITEGWVDWGIASIAEDLLSSFHFFGSICVLESVEAADDSVDGGANLQKWGQLVRRNGVLRESFPALAVKSIGRGKAVLLAVNLMETFSLIQQGMKVIKDGPAAPDGTGAIDDNILKADDACVLDWNRDRNAVIPEGAPFYLHPIVDEWRILFMRLIHQLFTEAGQTFGQLWLWPDGISALGHISHDTDRNIVDQAHTTLDRLAEAGVHSTWCIIMPGYPEDVNRRIVAEGHEVALHYNALGSEIPESQWKESHFKYQFDMLQEQFPDQKIVSNKNHYLRWEGDFQLLQWCERQGIRMEQTRGGTKQGNKGFLAGTSHPFLSFDPSTGQHATNVVSLPTLSWDPPFPMRCTAEEAFALTDRARDVYGVAHFLFHPYMVAVESQVGDIMVKLVQYGRSQGLDWWTGEQILKWFDKRRQITVEWSAGEAGESAQGRIVSTADTEIEGITVLFAYNEEEFGTSEHPWGIAVDNGAELARVTNVIRYGCKYKEVQLHVQPGETKIWLTR